MIFFMPTETDVQGLKVGSETLDCFGHWRRVTEITYRGTDVEGRPYVGFYTTISGSYKVGRLERTVPMSKCYTSAAIDAVERQMRAGHALDAAIDLDEPGLFAAALRSEEPIFPGRATEDDIREYRKDVTRRARASGFDPHDPDIKDEVDELIFRAPKVPEIE
jgi:hypothetical protein